jgi:putative ABC transport system substrate-binding protein
MRQREFLSVMGGAAVWPVMARARPAERVRRIAMLLPETADDADYQARVGAFLQALTLLGSRLSRHDAIPGPRRSASPFRSRFSPAPRR